MPNAEIDFCVPDCKKALPLYKEIFDVEVVEATDLEKGGNEAVFLFGGTRFHILDENPEAGLIAPKAGDHVPVWFNVMAESIELSFDKAIALGCSVIMPISRLEAMGVSIAMFKDPFNYIWQITQLNKIVPFEERVELLRREEPGQ